MKDMRQPSFVCFTTELPGKDGKGNVGLIVRVEDMTLTDEQTLIVKHIQEKTVAELREQFGL